MPAEAAVGHRAGVDSRQGWRWRSPPAPLLALAVVWVVSMLLLGWLAPVQYRALLQEDQAVEWATAWLFLAAGLGWLLPAVRRRRAGDLLVAIFCLIVAGEEISWGQRLLGLSVPDYFLAHNAQQELTLHNLIPSAVQPKWFLLAALAGYGVLLPLVGRTRRGVRLLARLGVSVPAWRLAPAFAGASALLLWYPLTLTGEWVELLAGALFLAATPLPPVALWATLALAVPLGAGLVAGAGLIGRASLDQQVACAGIDVAALRDDLTIGTAATPRLGQMRSIHKRVWTATTDGYLTRDRLTGFDDAVCAGEAADAARRRYAIDPWGTAYWVSVERDDQGQRRAVVYSFGPNRRRDGTAQAPDGDDVGAVGWLPRTTNGPGGALITIVPDDREP